MRRAIILGGTGAIGFATARRLATAGWSVAVTGRDRAWMPAEIAELGVSFHAIDRADHSGLERLIADGADLLVDTLAFAPKHLEGILPLLRNVTSTAVISARAVYADGRGRHLNSLQNPEFTGLVTEDHTTLAADYSIDPFTREGYGRARAAVDEVALTSGLPITLIRASKVYGAWARNARTRYFLERMLAGAKEIRLANVDAPIDQLSAAANIAQLIEIVADKPATRVLNCADPSIPTMREFVDVIAMAVGWQGQVVAAANDPTRNPFSASVPMTLDTSRATALGYRPVGTTLELIGEEARWVKFAAARFSGQL